MSGAAIAAKVSAGLKTAGDKAGSGPLAGAILRTSGADETTYPPTPGTVTEHACTVILTNYSARDRDGTQITARDVKALIAPDAASDPRNGDRLRVSGETFSIVNVEAVKPGGVVLMWKCQVRSANG